MHKALIPAWVRERGLDNAACDLGVLAPSLHHPHHITWYVFSLWQISSPHFYPASGLHSTKPVFFIYFSSPSIETHEKLYIHIWIQMEKKSLSAPDFEVHKAVVKWGHPWIGKYGVKVQRKVWWFVRRSKSARSVFGQIQNLLDVSPCHKSNKQPMGDFP